MTLILAGANVIMGNRLYHVLDGTNKPNGYVTAESFEKPAANYRWKPEYRIAPPEALELWSELIRCTKSFRVTDTLEDQSRFMTAQRNWNLYIQGI